MTWTERILGAAIGALVIGIVAALIGLGPERVFTGLLTATAAALGGALLDDFVESRARAATRAGAGLSRSPTGDAADIAGPQRTTPDWAPDSGPPPGPPLHPEHHGASKPDIDVPIEDTAPPEPGPRGQAVVPPADALVELPPPPRPPVIPPAAQLSDARRPKVDQVSARWEAVANRDLVETYLSTSASPGAVCVRCGRTVQRPADDPTIGPPRPVDCPVQDDPVVCVLTDRDDRLMINFRSLRDVFSERQADSSPE